MSFAGGFPGMGTGVAPSAVPAGAQHQQAGAGFVLTIPPDPSWEPFDPTDLLENDGYYQCRVKSDKPRNDQSKDPGVFLSLEIVDPDNAGKMLSKFLQDPQTTKNDTWWIWRGLLRSVTGNLDAARGGMQYQAGMLTGRTIYVRTGAYTDNRGTTRTGVDAFVTQDEYNEAAKAGKHRWPSRVRGGGGGAAGAGALPTGLPSAFPGMAGPGLPGMPTTPTGGGAPVGFPTSPQPPAATPMQQAPQTPVGFPQQPPQVQPAATQPQAFAFPPSPVTVAPAAAAPPPVANGAPQPIGTGFPGFPGFTPPAPR